MGKKPQIATLVVLMILSLLVASTNAEIAETAALEDIAEYDIKAAFLINFMRFTEWPGDAFTDANSPFVLVIFGKDPFDRSAFDQVANKPVNGRRLEIKRTRDLKAIEGCHLLFLNGVDEKTLSSVISSVRNRNVLTVGEGGKFAAAGGMIRFYLEDTNVRFEINLTQVQRSDLSVSAKLLSLAKVIR